MTIKQINKLSNGFFEKLKFKSKLFLTLSLNLEKNKNQNKWHVELSHISQSPSNGFFFQL